MPEQAFARPWWLLSPGRLHPLWWIGVAVVWLWGDVLTGPKTDYPVLYVIPVILAAWYSGWRPAVALALVIPLVHFAFLVALWRQPGAMLPLAAMTTLRGVVVIALALWFARLAEHERALRHHVQTLEGLLPICSFCKRIRNEAGEWERLESFISGRSDAQFSHAFCPSCWKTHYPELGEAPPD